MKVFITQLDMPPPIPAAVAGGLVAQPGGQAGALVLPAQINIVTTVAAGTAVVLSILGGRVQDVIDASASSLPVYPTSGTMFTGEPGVNVPVMMPAGGYWRFVWDGVSTWYYFALAAA